MNLEIFNTDKKQLDGFNDPFKQGNISSIMIWIAPTFDKVGIRYEADISFKNGLTSGKHEIRCTDFNELITKVKSFIEHL